ncbi:Dimethyl sulfoxide reductase DmsA precursor [Edwardsiella tarda]|nr:Dimethyl sulfoxide reductase DmsA precursor [Edwardsiella tarda]
MRIFNDRGEVRINAKVTPRVLPGVVALSEGAWYSPDGARVDHGGCINVLTTQRPSPLAKGNPSHTNLFRLLRLKGVADDNAIRFLYRLQPLHRV